MALKFWDFFKGIRLKKESSTVTYDASTEGAMYNHNDTVLRTHIGGADRAVVTADQSQTLTNKTIDADNNTITNIDNNEIKAAAGIVYSKLSLTGSIVNADISASAAIDYSKLNLSGSIVNADINASAAIAYSKLNLSGSIVNGDISASAAIDRSKTASGTAYRILANNSSGVMSENAAITASRAVTSDANGQLVASATTATELGYVSGVTSSIQTQLDSKTGFTFTNTASNITLANGTFYFVDTSAARSLTLPAASNGAQIILKDVNGLARTNNITIVRAGSESIEGVAANYVIKSDFDSVLLVSNGTNWYVLYRQGQQPTYERINFTNQTSTPSDNVTGDVYSQVGSTSIESGLYMYDGTGYTPVNYRKENLIMNGAFDFWQRGTSFNLSTVRKYADRWISETVIGGTATVTRQSHTLGDLPGEPKYYFRFTQGSVNAAILQKIRDVRATAGKTYTLSFYARTSDSSNLAVEVLQDFGSGGSPSSDVSVATLSSATTTSFQKFTVTFTVPSISGKTIGTNEDSALSIYLSNSTGTGSATKDFSLVMLNEGRFAANFSRFGGSIETEKAACQTYFVKSYRDADAPGTTNTNMEHSHGADSTALIAVNTEFPERMVSVPTITLYDNAGTSGVVTNRAAGGGVTNGITASATQITEMSFKVTENTAGTRNGVIYNYTADSEF